MDKVGIPNGIPSVTYVRVLNGVSVDGITQNDLTTEGNSVTVAESGQPSTKHEVAQILEPGLSDQDVCEHVVGNLAGSGLGATLNPISAFVHDAATAVLMLVGSRSTKKWSFLKRTLLPFIANELFGNIMDKEQEGNCHDYSTEITLSAFEIQDEIITDLLRPANRGLFVSVSNPEIGVTVNGLHKEPTKDEMTLRKHFLEACENRASHTLPPGASIDTSSGIWEVTLTQHETDDSGIVHSCKSKLFIIDVPSVDSLVNSKDVTLLGGPNLHKSLITFVDVVRKLSTPSRAALAPFRLSKLTHYLSEVLGGNSIVVGLGLVAPGEPLQSRSTLAIMGALSRAVHYPISSREFTDVLQGLLCKYRSLILQLEDEIDNGAPIGSTVPPQIVTEKLVTSLQQELAKATLDKNTALSDSARLFEMMELLKAKYRTVMDQKGDQSKELIQSEEEKMTISRALVELKLQHSQLQEQFEKERFELTSSAMQSKNDLFDMEAQLLIARTETAKLKEKNAELEKMTAELRIDLSSSNATITELRLQLAKENDKNIELSSELLTIINERENLSVKCKDLQSKTDQDGVKLMAMKSEIDKYEVTAIENQTLMRQLEEKLLAARAAEGTSMLELKSMKLDIEHNKLDYERSAADFLRSKDEAYDRMRKTAEMDIQSLEKQKDELRMQIHKQDRRIRELEKDCARSVEDMMLIQRNKDAVSKDLDALRVTYRNQLTLALMPPQTMDGVNELPEDANMKRMLESYGTVEGQNAAKIEKLQALLQNYKTNYRNLYDNYKTAVEYIEEKLPIQLQQDNIDGYENQTTGQRLNTTEEERTLLQMIHDLESNRKYMDENMHGEDIIGADERNETQIVIADQEKTNVLVGTYRKHIEKAEDIIASQKQEIAALNVNLKQLVQHSEEWKLQAAQQYKEKLKKQITELKAQQELALQERRMSSRGGLSTMDMFKSPSKPIVPLAIVKQVSEVSIGESLYLDDDKEQHDMRPSKRDGELLMQLQEMEGYNTEISTKNIALEEELRNYKIYMRENISSYKKQIIEWKSKVAMLQDQLQYYLKQDNGGIKPDLSKQLIPHKPGSNRPPSQPLLPASTSIDEFTGVDTVTGRRKSAAQDPLKLPVI